MSEERNKNPNITFRIEQEIKDWLIDESFKYRSWNLFIKELIKRYENKI